MYPATPGGYILWRFGLPNEVTRKVPSKSSVRSSPNFTVMGFFFLEPTALFCESGTLGGPADRDGREDYHWRDHDGVDEMPDLRASTALNGEILVRTGLVIAVFHAMG